MKKLIVIILLSILFVGCTYRNSNNTMEWIEKAKKPIICREAPNEYIGNNRYTLIDANGNLYETGDVRLSLPDTLK